MAYVLAGATEFSAHLFTEITRKSGPAAPSLMTAIFFYPSFSSICVRNSIISELCVQLCFVCSTIRWLEISRFTDTRALESLCNWKHCCWRRCTWVKIGHVRSGYKIVPLRFEYYLCWQRVDIPARARHVLTTALRRQTRLEEDLYWIVRHVATSSRPPPTTRLSRWRDRTELNCAGEIFVSSNNRNAWNNLSCLLQTYCHWSASATGWGCM